ncbi:hypothetical protein HCN44_006256 [Aphidius gifuensis]|uniref:Uncharacterized protein n=1 Tax=Aphidius gifuensis TaxID=684658 RepID=A0A834XYJ4_APHGI|nr:putative uncharacterized protein DDB_G0277255 [Aphidius gifuensis]KAF7993196.1 hypothetical protein HCN44_006256 [Aphidius gifuensis]
MPTLKKIAKSVKRSRVLVKKRTLKPRIIKKRIRNPIYEKLKNNNIALARALSKEKQECQYLYSQNIKLTGQVQDMQGSLKKREDIISGILKNSSEALKLLVQATNCVTTTILSCQQVVGNQQMAVTNQLKSTTNSTMSRRESVRKSSGKSPARGVVQPMVSGHTITKPVINICRINMPRLIASPNVSDIEESTEVPSPSNSESHTPIRLVNKQRRSLNRHINSIIMPQRIRRSTSSRVSDEDEQISPPPPQPEPSLTPPSPPYQRKVSSRRMTDRKRKSSNTNNQQSLTETQDTSNNSNFDLTKSPRVSLQDVSVLMQNSQTVNVKSLLENVCTSANDINEAINNIQTVTETNISSTPQSSPDKSDEKESSEDSPTYGFDTRLKKKKKKHQQSEEEDPLEGPSWLHNNSLSSEQNNSSLDVTSSIIESRKLKRSLPKIISDELISPKKLNTKLIGNEKNDSINDSYCDDNENYNDQNGIYNDDVDNDDITQNIPTLPMSRFAMVTQQRSHANYDDDDFTMIINRPLPSTQNESFNVDELELPERPFADPQAVVDIEPEITKTIRLIGNNNLRLSTMRTTNIFNNSMNPDDISMIVAPVPEPIVDDSSDDDCSTIITFNSSHNRGVNKCIIESSSESEDSLPPSPPKKTIKRKIIKRKDPSTVKVVLEKLSHVNTSDRSLTNINTSRRSLTNINTSKRSSSPDPRKSSYNFTSNMSSMRVLDQESDDSDSSNISTNSRASSRPRRQKAPLNLKEPNIRRKLRR